MVTWDEKLSLFFYKYFFIRNKICKYVLFRVILFAKTITECEFCFIALYTHKNPILQNTQHQK